MISTQNVASKQWNNNKKIKQTESKPFRIRIFLDNFSKSLKNRQLKCYENISRVHERKRFSKFILWIEYTLIPIYDNNFIEKKIKNITKYPKIINKQILPMYLKK